MSLTIGAGLALALLIIPRLLQSDAHRVETRGLLALLWWINRTYCAFWHRLTVENAPPLPETGAAILISNHTCGIDHMILQSTTRRLLGFMIAQEYYDWPIARPFCRLSGCIPVRRDGRDLAATRAALRAVGEGRVVPIFPEGRINPHSGRDFLEPRPGAAFIALRAGVPVIPAYIRGTPETNNIQRAAYTPSHVRVRFGAPLDLSDLGDRHLERDDIETLTRRMMDAIVTLRDEALAAERGETP